MRSIRRFITAVTLNNPNPLWFNFPSVFEFNILQPNVGYVIYGTEDEFYITMAHGESGNTKWTVVRTNASDEVDARQGQCPTDETVIMDELNAALTDLTLDWHPSDLPEPLEDGFNPVNQFRAEKIVRLEESNAWPGITEQYYGIYALSKGWWLRLREEAASWMVINDTVTVPPGGTFARDFWRAVLRDNDAKLASNLRAAKVQWAQGQPTTLAPEMEEVDE